MYWLHAGFVLAHVLPYLQTETRTYLPTYLSIMLGGGCSASGRRRLFRPHIEEMALIPPLVATTY